MAEWYTWEWFFTAALPLTLYILFDVFVYLKMLSYILFGTYFQKKIKALDTAALYGICSTQDVDLYLTHMNNNRMARMMDLAVYYYFSRTSLVNAIFSGVAWKTASTLRFRRPVPIFSIYKIETKVIHWDKNNLYLEQQFKTRDKFVRAVVLSKFFFNGIDLNDVFDCKSPEATEELTSWISSMDCSSKRLRPIGSKSD